MIRGKHDYFTSADVADLRELFNQGMSAREAARRVKCSHRTACKYYAMFKGRPTPKFTPPNQARPGGWDVYRNPRPVTLVKLKFMGEV